MRGLLSKSFVEFAQWQGALNAAHAYGTVNPNAQSSLKSDGLTTTKEAEAAKDSISLSEQEPLSIAAVC